MISLMDNSHADAGIPIEDQYPKLVRDKIPEIVEATGKIAAVRAMLDDDEYQEFLYKKLVEEATELSSAEGEDRQKEEMADVMEVFEAILVLKGLSKSDVASVQAQKRDKRGGFIKRLLMLEKP